MMRHDRGQRMPGRFGVVEVAPLINLQTHRKLVKVLRDLMIVVEAFVEIRLAVTIQIVQDH
jgi:hypothetical protein